MFIIALAVCSFYFILLPDLATAGHKAYISDSLSKHFNCESLPQNDFCQSLDIEVQKGTAGAVNGNLSTYNETVIQTLRSVANMSDACLKSVMKTRCLAILRCTNEKVSADIDEYRRECAKGRTVCPNFLFNNILDCNANAQRLENKEMIIENPECKDLQDKTGFCPVVDYKRVEYSGDNATKTFQQIRRFVDEIKPNATTECYLNLRDAACGSFPACSDDRNYIVVLLSKQECIRAFKCLPEEIAKRRQVICDHNPDENTAKTVEAPGNTGNITYSKLKINLTLLIVFLQVELF